MPGLSPWDQEKVNKYQMKKSLSSNIMILHNTIEEAYEQCVKQSWFGGYVLCKRSSASYDESRPFFEAKLISIRIHLPFDSFSCACFRYNEKKLTDAEVKCMRDFSEKRYDTLLRSGQRFQEEEVEKMEVLMQEMAKQQQQQPPLL